MFDACVDAFSCQAAKGDKRTTEKEQNEETLQQ